MRKIEITALLLLPLLLAPFAYATTPSAASGIFSDTNSLVSLEVVDGNTFLVLAEHAVYLGTLGGTYDGMTHIVIFPDSTLILHGRGVWSGTVNGKTGTADLRFEGTGDLVANSLQGTIVLVGATGGLATLHGELTWHSMLVGPGEGSGTYSGQIHFDP